MIHWWSFLAGIIFVHLLYAALALFWFLYDYRWRPKRPFER